MSDNIDLLLAQQTAPWLHGFCLTLFILATAPQAKTLATSIAGGGDVPRSRAAPLSDPTGAAQRVGSAHHADEMHT